jgi:argininosuccinate lyase
MTGQELAWDRDRMARLLGFAAPQPHPLTAVASRTWVLEVAAECSTAGVTLSRFVTDLMSWGGGQLIDLPDELSGISSAMPQKKNFPILERIRGRTAHLTSWYADAATAQRATPYSNSVEVAKEGGVSGLDAGLSGLESLLRLLTCVLERLSCDTERMRSACRGHHLGAFTLANQLTLRTGMPWRLAQVVVGEYVVAAGPDDDEARPDLLVTVAARHGWTVPDAAGLLGAAGDPDRLLTMKSEHGSAHPAAVAELLSAQAGDLADLDRRSGERRRRADVADRLTEMFAHDTEEERCATTA